jgi:hypothetical protein
MPDFGAQCRPRRVERDKTRSCLRHHYKILSREVARTHGMVLCSCKPPACRCMHAVRLAQTLEMVRLKFRFSGLLLPQPCRGSLKCMPSSCYPCVDQSNLDHGQRSLSSAHQ